MNFLSQNIKLLRKRKKITQTELAERLGVKRSLIGSYEEGRAIPKIPVLQEMSRFFEYKIDDLIGTDLSESEPEPAIVKETFKVLSVVVDSRNEERIAMVPTKATAGYLDGYGDIDYIEQLPTFSMPIAELHQDRTYRVFQIKGDSMLPIPSGAYIFCEYILDATDIKDNDTYVVLTQDDGLVYKRVVNHSDKNGCLLLKSDNQEYQPYEVEMSEVREVWKAKGYLSFELPNPEASELQNLSSMMQMMQQQIGEIKKKL